MTRLKTAQIKGEQMGALDLAQRTIRDDAWDKGEEVVIQELNYADSLQAQSYFMKNVTMADYSNKRNQSQKKVSSLGLDEQTIAKMDKCIVSWTFMDGDKPLPKNVASIKRLRGCYAKFIADAIKEINPEMEEEFQSDGGDGDSVG